MMPKRVQKEHLAAIAALEASVFHAPWSEEALALLTTDTAFGFVVTEGDRAPLKKTRVAVVSREGGAGASY